MLIPVFERYRLVCDVRLLRVELLVGSNRDVIAGAIGESLGLHRGIRRRRSHVEVGLEVLESQTVTTSSILDSVGR